MFKMSQLPAHRHSCLVSLSSLLLAGYAFFIIGPESDNWLYLSLADSLTHTVTFSKLY